MKKLKLYGAGNQNSYNHFEIEKKQIFVKYFREFLSRLGFENYKINYVLIEYNKNNDFCDLKLKNVSDCFEHIGNKRYNIDVYIGKRINMIVYVAYKNRKKVMNEIMKFCEWTKSK